MEMEGLLGECRKRGVRVEFVPTNITRDYIGMNSEAAKAMGFEWPVELGEKPSGDWILIDKDLKAQEKEETLRHEMVEMDLMRGGAKYFPAHDIALKKERRPVPRKKIRLKKRERQAEASLSGAKKGGGLQLSGLGRKIFGLGR
jgi:hypothetical protein